MAISHHQSIFLIGPMAAGKSTIGRRLAEELGLDFYDSDQEVEKRSGVDLNWLFDVEGEEGFKRRERQVIEELTNQPNIVLATGGDTVLVPENRTLLRTRGKIIYLYTSLKQQIERTLFDRKRPLLQHGEPKLTLEKIRDERQQYYEELAEKSFTTDKKSPYLVVKNIIYYLENCSDQGC